MENVKEIQELLGMVGRKQPDGGQEAAKYAYFQESKYIMQRRHSLSYIAHSKPPSSLAFLVLIYLALPDSP
jgi:hypothetical protein